MNLNVTLMDYNDVLQYVAIGIILVLCVVWIIKRIKRNGGSHDSCDSTCDGCPLSDNCNKNQ